MASPESRRDRPPKPDFDYLHPTERMWTLHRGRYSSVIFIADEEIPALLKWLGEHRAAQRREQG